MGQKDEKNGSRRPKNPEFRRFAAFFGLHFPADIL
jgi:hypothetical protein